MKKELIVSHNYKKIKSVLLIMQAGYWAAAERRPLPAVLPDHEQTTLNLVTEFY